MAGRSIDSHPVSTKIASVAASSVILAAHPKCRPSRSPPPITLPACPIPRRIDRGHLPAVRRTGLQRDVEALRHQVDRRSQAYLDHSILGPRLLVCAEAVVHINGRSAAEIFGSPDDLKLRSSATLFASVLPADSAFNRLLEKYYRGERDGKTLELITAAEAKAAGADKADREDRG